MAILRTTAEKQVERACHQCRGHFTGKGYRKGLHTYCCDVCARRASGPGILSGTLIAGALVVFGYYLAVRRSI